MCHAIAYKQLHRTSVAMNRNGLSRIYVDGDGVDGLMFHESKTSKRDLFLAGQLLDLLG